MENVSQLLVLNISLSRLQQKAYNRKFLVKEIKAKVKKE